MTSTTFPRAAARQQPLGSDDTALSFFKTLIEMPPAVSGAIVTAAILCCATCGLGQESSTSVASVTATVSSDEVQVAQPFTFSIRCRVPEGSQASFPQVTEQLADFDIVGIHDDFDIPNKDGPGRTWTRTLTLESIVTGERALPSLEVQVSSGNSVQRMETPPVRVRVISVLEEGSDPLNIRDIRPLLDVEVPPREGLARWTWWLGGGVLTAIAAGAFVVLRRRHYISPKQWALEQLDALTSADDGIGRDNRVEQLTRIVTRFLQLQLNVDAPMQTTPELLGHPVIKNQLSEAARSLAQSLLETADQVKYAGLPVDESQVDDMIQQARQIVLEVADAKTAAIVNENISNTTLDPLH